MPSPPKKTAAKTKQAEVEVAPVAPVVTPEASKVDVATPPPAPKKATKKAAEEVVKNEVVKDEVAKDEVKKEGDDVSTENTSAIENSIQLLVDKISSLAVLIKDIQSSIKPVVKEHDKLRKIVDRIQKKRDNARKSPSGFAKPNKISNELCDFIGVPHGTEKSRTEITRYINAYVKEHNLNKPTNRRIILPDEKLKKILKTTNDEEVTFFILQRLISHHFPSNKATVTTVSATAAV